MIIQFCGLSGAGKTTLGKALCQKLTESGIDSELIDGDEYRSKILNRLGFSKADRQENIRCLSFLASRFSKHNIITIISAINPYEDIRKEIKSTYDNVKTIFIDCSLQTLKKRDTKGLYKRSALPENDPNKLNNLSGINDTFEIPDNPDLYINTTSSSINECVEIILSFIIAQN